MQDRRNYSDRNDRDNNGDSAQLFIAKGRNDGMDIKSLTEFVSYEANIDEDAISNVKILDAFSFFVVSNEDAEEILDIFQKKAGDARPLVSRAKRKSSGGSGGSSSGSRDGGFRDNGFRDRDGRSNDRNSSRSDYRSGGGDFGGNSDRRGGNGGGNYNRNGNNNRSDYGNKPRRNSDY